MTTQHLAFRLLRKLSVLPYLNVTKSISFAGQSITIPVLNELGYPNLFLKPNWLYGLINELYTTDGNGFIDVGANIGQTLIATKTANHSIRYVGFEPSISCCYYLRELIQGNAFSNCQVHNVALSDELKEVFLETNGEADPTGSVITALRPHFFSQCESVLAMDYDSLPVDLPVTCIKIDVEGGELEVLLGMRRLIEQNRPYIICEILDSFSDDAFQFTQDRASRVCELLVHQAYSIIQLIQNKTTDKIIGFREIATIQLKQWAEASLQHNDYIFYPTEHKQDILTLLSRLSG